MQNSISLLATQGCELQPAGNGGKHGGGVQRREEVSTKREKTIAKCCGSDSSTRTAAKRDVRFCDCKFVPAPWTRAGDEEGLLNRE